MAKSVQQLREAARACQDCPLWANATQTVFGAGDPHARVMLVGEQPGDEEDKKGLPFVGPAGRLLDQALEAAGVDREHLLRHERGEALQVATTRQATAA
jgi:uracil-DNA glycosylase